MNHLFVRSNVYDFFFILSSDPKTLELHFLPYTRRGDTSN